MALWTAGILLCLGLVWFVGVVAVPAWGVRAVLVRASNMREEPGEYVIANLGGGQAAARRLGLYLRMPGFLVPHRRLAAGILGQCGYAATPELLQCVVDSDREVRLEAVDALGRMRAVCATKPLMRRLGDPDRLIRSKAAWALGEIGLEARAAAPVLEKCLSDENEPVRAAAAEALKKIRGEEPPK
jgi:hypothetical protein